MMMFNELRFKKITIDEFISVHNHIEYCEALIYPDGDITYGVPSHTKALEKISGIPYDKLYDMIPIQDSPFHWLLDYTGCIAVYTRGYMLPKNTTKEQLESLNKLMKVNLVYNENFRK